MCNECDKNVLNDDLDDLFGPLGAARTHTDFMEQVMLREPVNMDSATEFAKAALANATHDPKGEARYEEPCPKCKGSGRFIGYTGRVVGNCFHCKGAGKVFFKTSPEARAAQQESRDAKKAREAAELTAKFKQWLADYDAEWK